MLRSGCLACHQIGKAGNPGPGPNLTDVGARLTAAEIANALADPTAPMPSFQEIKHSDPIAWRALVAYLARLRTG
jgi:menaquinol-cytochrome c reductase cytochrome b/c subunit